MPRMTDDLMVAVQRQREAMAKVQAVLDRVALVGMMEVFELRVMPGRNFEVLLCCMWEPYDPETKADRKFRTLARVQDVSEEAVVDLCFRLLRKTLVHELGELLLLDGERPFYPHDPEDPLTNDPFVLERDGAV